MLNIFKKKNKTTEVYSPVLGSIHNISTATDPVFQAKIIGDGFFILPSSNEIYAPIEGIIDSVFPTKHAFTIKTENGINVLVHIGSDTVQLEGIPFELNTSEGSRVKPGDLLVIADFEYIKENGKGIEVYVVFPELDSSKEIRLIKNDKVSNQDVVAII